MTKILLGSIEYNEAKRIRALLQERGVTLEMAAQPQQCTTRGCAVKVEVFAREEDLPKIGEFFQQERIRAFDGLEVDHSLLEEVFDPEKGVARCPACGTQFSTSATECPDCGLGFAAGTPGGESCE